MKTPKSIFVICMIFLTTGLFSQSLWQGNAIRGTEDLFSEFYDAMGTHLAASRALPIGTEVKVFNQLNNKFVLATIVTETSRPGIFISLSPAASEEIGLESGDMILVNIQETLSASDNSPFQLYQQDRQSYLESNSFVDEPIESIDPDNNPFILGEEELLALADDFEEDIPEVVEDIPDVVEDNPDVVEDNPDVEEDITDVVEDITDVVEDITDVVEDITDVVEDIPDVEEDHRIYDEIIEGGFSSGEVIALIEPAPHRDNRDAGEELFGDNIEDTQDVEEPVEEPVDQTTEEPIEEPILADRIIYFLTPAELRPPEIVEIIEEDGSSTVSLVPQEVTQDELNEIISEPIQRGSRYIQVASYSEESLDQVYCEMAQLKTLFPMILQPDEVDGKTVYRLLVGPATRDEMGVLLKYHLPAQGYNEAMEYKQP